MKVIVIGGGASGLIAAIAAAEKNDVTILEKNSSCGKKILITGNGKCNYYNGLQGLEYYHSNYQNLSEFINSSDYNKILNFFDSIGVVPEIKDNYYYPMSNQSISIRNALVTEAKSKNVEIKNEIEVKEIKKINDKFIITTDNETYEADVVILATGGKSYPKTGSTGSGYEFAKSFGHSIIKPLPGLVQLITKDKITECSGVRVKVKTSLLEDNKCIKEEAGELQITDYGISGICIMQLSSFISQGLDNNKKEEVKINFLPTIDNLKKHLDDLNNKIKNRTISQLLENYLNYKLVNYLLKKVNISINDTWNSISENQKDILVENINNYKVIIDNTKGFDNAQVTVGGVPLDEINNNFESKKVKNLYIVGELLDVNGDCGGYNLTWAWLSGYKAGESIHD